MEKNYGLIDLTESELKLQSGGCMLSPIKIFNPIPFFQGLFAGFHASTVVES